MRPGGHMADRARTRCSLAACLRADVSGVAILGSGRGCVRERFARRYLLTLRTNTSRIVPLVSLSTKSLAALSNATKRPSALMTGRAEPPLPLAVPALLMLTRVVVPVF